MPAPYHPRVKWLLAIRGVSPRLMEALEGEPVLDFPDSPKGAGMAGTSGAGKSFALTRHLADHAQAILAKHPDPDNALWPARSVVFADWIEQSEALKRMIGLGQGEAIETWVEAAKTVRRFYLDDFGRERLTGPNDYALGIIREVLHHRHGHMLPVFWTTNLEVKALGDLYQDAPLIGRMIEAWRPVIVRAPNQRMARPA